jgi:glycosyltransferase involved in cell wall biosynthesis
MGEFIAFLDDDDMWFPDKLMLQINVLENSPMHVGGIYSGFIAMDSAKQISHTRIPTRKGDIYHDLLVKNVVGTPSTVLIRKTCVERVGSFDENISYGTDRDYFLRISKHFHFEYIAAPLIQYRIHDVRLSNNPEIVAKGLASMEYKYRDEVGKLKRLWQRQLGLQYLSVGVLFCHKGQIRRGITAFMKSVLLNPFEPRGYFNLGISLLGKSTFIRIKNLKDELVAPLRAGKIKRY